MIFNLSKEEESEIELFLWDMFIGDEDRWGDGGGVEGVVFD